MSTKKPHVLIVGAGIGGLSLAQCLRKQGVSYEIFERDAGDLQGGGWCLTIHTVLEEMAVKFPDDMPPMDVTDHLRSLDLPAQYCLYLKNDPEHRIGVTATYDPVNFRRCDRYELRKWLATNIDYHCHKKVVSFQETDDAVNVLFEDGTTATGDILVAADGANSSIRKQILGAPDLLKDIGLGTVGGEFELSGAELAEQMELGHSAYAAMVPNPKGPEHGIVGLFLGMKKVQPDGLSAGFYWFFTITQNDEEKRRMTNAPKEELRAYADELAELFHPDLRRNISKTTAEQMIVQPFRNYVLALEELPVGRVTLMGDAAHCMPPFRGQGAVQSIIDAFRLSDQISSLVGSEADGASIRKVMANYQAEMVPRGSKAARDSVTGLSMNDQPILWGNKAGSVPRVPIDLEKVRRT